PAEDGIRDKLVTGVQTCALPIFQLDDRGVFFEDGPQRKPRGQQRDSAASPLDARYRSAAQAVAMVFERHQAGLRHGGQRTQGVRSEERRVGKEGRCWWWRAEQRV